MDISCIIYYYYYFDKITKTCSPRACTPVFVAELTPDFFAPCGGLLCEVLPDEGLLAPICNGLFGVLLPAGGGQVMNYVFKTKKYSLVDIY